MRFRWRTDVRYVVLPALEICGRLRDWDPKYMWWAFYVLPSPKKFSWSLNSRP